MGEMKFQNKIENRHCPDMRFSCIVIYCTLICSVVYCALSSLSDSKLLF